MPAFKNIRNFAKLKTYQVQLSSCAQFKEEIISRKRGWQIRICECTATRKNNNKLLKHPPKPRQVRNQNINPLQNRPHNCRFSTFSFISKIVRLFSQNNIPVLSSSMLRWSDRYGGFRWVRLQESRPAALDCSLVKRRVYVRGGLSTGGLITRTSLEQTKVLYDYCVHLEANQRRADFIDWYLIALLMRMKVEKKNGWSGRDSSSSV